MYGLNFNRFSGKGDVDAVFVNKHAYGSTTYLLQNQYIKLHKYKKLTDGDHLVSTLLEDLPKVDVIIFEYCFYLIDPELRLQIIEMSQKVDIPVLIIDKNCDIFLMLDLEANWFVESDLEDYTQRIKKINERNEKSH